MTDKIVVKIEDLDFVREAVRRHSGYIGSQTLAREVVLEKELSGRKVREVEIDEVVVKVVIDKD